MGPVKNIISIFIISVLGLSCFRMDESLQRKVTPFKGNTNNYIDHVKRLSEYVLRRTVRIYRKCWRRSDPSVRGDSWGSGVVLHSNSEKGYSLVQTARHVTTVSKRNKCGKIYVQYIGRNKKEILKGEARVVYKDKKSDLALLKVNISFGVSTIIAKANNFQGQLVWGAGFPVLHNSKKNKLSISFSHGIIQTVDIESMTGSKTFIRYSIPITNGFSGGGIWNYKGELVGVVSFMTGRRVWGAFIPTHGNGYGPGVKDLKKFYSSSKKYKYLLKNKN